MKLLFSIFVICVLQAGLIESGKVEVMGSTDLHIAFGYDFVNMAAKPDGQVSKIISFPKVRVETQYSHKIQYWICYIYIFHGYFQVGIFKGFVIYGLEHGNNVEYKTKIEIIEGHFGSDKMKIKLTSEFGKPIDSELFFFGEFPDSWVFYQWFDFTMQLIQLSMWKVKSF